ncbi:hypothetical protein AaE_003967 [Aphanomyces astaci]|uniref:HTH psq-type domain-containing protein n=1 Tax=Aphanomyces astaci TaxID=112090 RepID=A0A6A5ASK3_APHAT|nr:hypothetical protein AaE_003967 [Aphanomyces astaci]
MTSESRRSRSTSGQRKSISLRFKVKVIQAYEATTGARKTFYCIGKEFGVQTGQVSRWVKAKDQINARAVFNPSVLTVNAGRPVTNPDVEAEVLEYFNTLQQDDIAISTNMLIIYAFSVDSDFHGGQPNALKKWVYMFPTQLGHSPSNPPGSKAIRSFDGDYGRFWNDLGGTLRAVWNVGERIRAMFCKHGRDTSPSGARGQDNDRSKGFKNGVCTQVYVVQSPCYGVPCNRVGWYQATTICGIQGSPGCPH